MNYKNMNREAIFVDIDETTARTIEDGVFPVVNTAYGTALHHDTVRDYRDVFGEAITENGVVIPMERKIEIFRSAVERDRGNNRIRPVSGAVERILELAGSYDIGMLTARQTALSDYTHEWATHYFGGAIGKILFSNCYYGGKRRKSDICQEEWVRIMVEDDMDYAIELAAAGILVYLLRRPWNEHRTEKHRNIQRVESWEEVLM